MLRVDPFRVIAFLFLAVCAALSQEAQPRFLPDAPSAEVPIYMNAAHLPLSSDLSRVHPEGSDFGHTYWSQVGQLSFSVPDVQQDFNQGPTNYLPRFLYSSLLKRNLNYRPSTNGTFIGRATYAAASIFVTRDDSGLYKLNTAYFVGMLTSALVHTAYRPYWRRSYSEPFSDFGSNIGNDAGMNLLHEFTPGLQQLVKSHAPKFVARVEARMSHD